MCARSMVSWRERVRLCCEWILKNVQYRLVGDEQSREYDT